MIYGSPSEEIRSTAAPEARFYVEDLQKLAQRDVLLADNFAAYLMESPTYWYIGVVRPSEDARYQWLGVAGIPREMEDVARDWFESLQDDIDIENLMREWGGHELQDEFEQFIARD
jgi:hypothetical protein